jgi:preprotein translocase subunit SecE
VGPPRQEDPHEGPNVLGMMGVVAVIVAIIILVFFGIGYGFGRLFL